MLLIVLLWLCWHYSSHFDLDKHFCTYWLGSYVFFRAYMKKKRVWLVTQNATQEVSHKGYPTDLDNEWVYLVPLPIYHLYHRGVGSRSSQLTLMSTFFLQRQIRCFILLSTSVESSRLRDSGTYELLRLSKDAPYRQRATYSYYGKWFYCATKVSHRIWSSSHFQYS